MTSGHVSNVLLVGAGAIGRLHAREMRACTFCTLSGVVDPTPEGHAWADSIGVAWFPTLADALASGRPDAAILATPNPTHRPLALDLIESGIVTLVEKPIASTLDDAQAIVDASQATAVPVLVGHHRRHNPIIRTAHDLIGQGRLGRIVSVAVLAMFRKPDDYFAATWRREAGGGPILINLIHEIDLVRHLYGEIVSVHAMSSNATRGFAVEDTASVLLRLDGGALVTIALSDCTAAPWSWDLQSGEIDSYPSPAAPVTTSVIAGSIGSLALPALDLWHYQKRQDWYEPLTRETTGYRKESPYVAQLRNLCAVARGTERPVVDAREGLLTLRATLAVTDSARSGTTITLSSSSNTPCEGS
ncbi:Gfo/Idh/MocA family protein [Gluconacetobacter dulcium]|uniref:Gfo/Idh/MocA family oxidoreductase n=1 Tax=Gluconacetobacter dulcium TaxID=2729096 RepID=A0ABR6F8C8_9PROT|nr:Gfo/Idh/MocA family oxidoreductase [Gluconacetobacter dulcium]MBB2193941.1 Gfo/Idh/MocA family oxidoreductase [Gluconacetobacter dulcium]